MLFESPRFEIKTKISVLCLYFFLCAPGIDRFLIPNYVYSILFGCVATFYFFYKGITPSKYLGFSIFDGVYLFISFVCLFIFIPERGDISGFIYSYLNIICSLLIGGLFYYFLNNVRKEEKEVLLNGVLYVVVGYALLKYIFLKLGVIIGDDSEYYRNYSGNAIIIKGFFNEPAHYSIVVSTLLFFCFFSFNNYVKRNVIIIFVAMFSVFFSLSLSGIFLFILALGLFLFSMENKKFILYVIPLFFVLLLFLYLIEFDGGISSSTLLYRLDGVVNGVDNSANYRVFQSWSFVKYLDNIYNILFGTGIGNNAYFSLRVMGLYEPFVGINVIGNAFFSGGLIFGLSLIFRLYFQFYSFYFFIYLVVLCFSHGYLVGPLFYPLLGIGSALILRGNNE